MSLRTCQHTAILFEQFTVYDELTKLEYHLCRRCWRRVQHLIGYKLVDIWPARPLTETEKSKLKTNVPF